MVGGIDEVLVKAEELTREAARSGVSQDKKDEKKEEKKQTGKYRIVSLKEKIPIEQYLKDESGKALQKLTDLAQKAEQVSIKKSTHFGKIKHRLHDSQSKYYPTTDSIKQKWATWNSANTKNTQDPLGFWKKVSSNSWNAEKSDRESRMRT